MAIIELTIVPLGTGTTSVSPYVAAAHKVLMEAPEPVRYQMTPMSTILEGELPDLLAVILRMHESPFLQGAMRVSTSIRIDDRRDKHATMASKLESVDQKLNSSSAYVDTTDEK